MKFQTSFFWVGGWKNIIAVCHFFNLQSYLEENREKVQGLQERWTPWLFWFLASFSQRLSLLLSKTTLVTLAHCLRFTLETSLLLSRNFNVLYSVHRFKVKAPLIKWLHTWQTAFSHSSAMLQDRWRKHSILLSL